jgi:hypothetical protein
MKFEPQFRKAFPDTVCETDKDFDRSNYTEWLESLVEEKFTSTNTAMPKLPNVVESMRAIGFWSELSRDTPESVAAHEMYCYIKRQLRQ